MSFQASFYKRYGRRVSHKSCWGKEEAETDSEYQERIIHQFGLKDQVIEVKNYSLIDIPLTFIVWLYLDILLGALFICGGFLSKTIELGTPIYFVGTFMVGVIQSQRLKKRRQVNGLEAVC